MNPSRVAQTIFRRRLISGDTLFTQINLNQHQAQIYSKLLESENLSPTPRLFPSLTNLIHIRLMSTEINEPSTSTTRQYENRLSLEKSPYLLQHATNPVDWYPWGEEAFEKAKNENKLIFLSVGYSTCHWCHVMEKESFENESVAEIMNQYYVNIKVDREERPDVDRVYMSFIQASSGSGGWPMSVFLTPNLEPITGGTYFPIEDKWGRPGFKTVLHTIAERWHKEKSTILESGKHILAVLKKASEKLSETASEVIPGDDSWRKCLQQFNKAYEPEFGGFSESPKFPQPSNLNFLFHLYSRDRESATGKHCLNMCLQTLKCMANGGIHDHISNGFSRYSTDSKWHVPHFEKMLYDQAQLAVSYCDAYSVSKEQFYADIVQDILLYVSRDLSHELGGFYSAEDADSYLNEKSVSKSEGAFYVWEYDEIVQHLTDKVDNVSYAEIFCYHYNIKKQGNVNLAQDPHNELKHKNVLMIFGSIAHTAEFFELPLETVAKVLETCRKILFVVQQKRPRPHLDSKILTAWNGLMISGFARAGHVLNLKTYIDRAALAASFLKKYLYHEETKSLLRCCYKGDGGQIVQNAVPIVGFLDDYAFLIKGLLDLYESSHDISWLEWAEVLQEQQDLRFWDEKDAGYFTSPAGDTSVLIRVKEDQDGAEPSGNSVSAHNLLRISAYLDRADLRTKTERLFASFSDRLLKIPIALPEMTSALMLYHDWPVQIFIVGPREDPATLSLLDIVRSRFLPGRLLVLANGADGLASNLQIRLDILPRLKMQDGRPTAYICRHTACSLPVTDPDLLATLLEDEYSPPRPE